MNDTNRQPMTLTDFLEESDKTYLTQLQAIRLFDPDWTAMWCQGSRQTFVKLFYHLRGHFHDFLWHLGNHAPEPASKKIIVANIHEEFGGKGQSHEQLYYQFARAIGIQDVVSDMVELPPAHFVDQFNRGHLAWLRRHDWISQLAAFSAYERLDNLDYPSLLTLARSFGLAEKDLLFFNVHTQVTHFAVTKAALIKDWSEHAALIRDGFHFIYGHQLQMWQQLSQAMVIYFES